MKLIKRTLCIFLLVLILFFGVSNSYFSPHKMDEVEAAEVVYMTYETMQAICYYLGSLFLGYSASAEVPDLTDDQIMQLGHAYIKSLYDVSGVNPFISDQLADTTQTLFTLISNKQAYVFGSEALKEVSETEFTVIMGGGNDDDNDDEDDEDEEKNTYKKINVGNAIDCLGALSLAGVSLFEDSMQYWVDLFSKGEANIIDDTYFGDILAEYVYSDDAWKIISTSEPYEYTGRLAISANYYDPYDREAYNYFYSRSVSYNFTSEDRIACYSFTTSYDDRTVYNIGFYGKIGNASWDWYKMPSTQVAQSGNNPVSSEIDFSSTTFIYNYPSGYYYQNPSIYLSTNVPIFHNIEDAQHFADTGQGIENAINYVNPYRIADWLQDDWSGELVDPLTGLSYLNDLAQLANQLGLNGLGDNPDLSDLYDYLRDKLQDINQQYDPATNPLVDPALDPIPYPSTLPVPVIDPTSPIVVQPVSDPVTDPSTDPEPSTDPDPSASPEPTSEPTSSGDIDSTRPVVDLSKFFPFCVPFDLIHLVQVLDADPVAPRWEIKLEPPLFPVEWVVVIDMADFESLAIIFRTGETLLFVAGLILITRGIIKG